MSSNQKNARIKLTPILKKFVLFQSFAQFQKYLLFFLPMALVMIGFSKIVLQENDIIIFLCMFLGSLIHLFFQFPATLLIGECWSEKPEAIISLIEKMGYKLECKTDLQNDEKRNSFTPRNQIFSYENENKIFIEKVDDIIVINGPEIVLRILNLKYNQLSRAQI